MNNEALVRFKEGFTNILEGLQCLGIDIHSTDFIGTPSRAAKGLVEIIKAGVDIDKEVEGILSSAFDAKGYKEIILARNIRTVGLCPHHLLPVLYTVNLGYIPNENGKVLGLSKLARLAELLAARPILQEVYTRSLTDRLGLITPLGSIAVVRGDHMCMQIRGVKQNSNVVTSSLEGVFMEDMAARAEVMNLMGNV